YNLSAGTTARLTSPAITFAGASYRVKFKMYRDSGYETDADNIKVYYNTTGLAGGTLLGTVNRSRALAPVVSEDGWYSYAFDIPGTVSGTGYVHFLGTSAYGNNIFIDEVTVEQIPALDAELSTVALSLIVPPATSNIPVAGTFKNFGTATINTIDVNWQVDNGTIHTQTLSGLSVAPNGTYNFTHQDTWSPSAGLYSVKVWVSNVNGGTDNDSSNDQIIKNISVASGTTTRLPLYEEFSSSTCGPCATFNGNFYNPFHDANASNYASIAYRVNWPGTGDPYYTAEVGTRVAYYGISGAPTLLVDANDGTNFDSAALSSDLTEALAKPSYFAISATKTLTGSDINLDINTTPYLSGTYRLFAAVVEKHTYNNFASNGETEFRDVFMKMIPDASGTSINFTNDVPVNTQLSANLDGLFIEEMSDLEVVVFIQDYAGKTVMQSTYATESLSTNHPSLADSVKLYPNPSNGIVRIKTDVDTDIVILDMTGKEVYKVKNAVNDQTINLTSLQKGVYVAKINNVNGELNQKIVIK
ncbi:T9SS type A sorting domain-containing protein, partial [Flavobacterium sp.]|uniref:T9SS type A sorting domain-containing protein n=1 Tax=Flavobacterium sp. TaxID=239 RepID=UPI0035B104D9